MRFLHSGCNGKKYNSSDKTGTTEQACATKCGHISLWLSKTAPSFNLQTAGLKEANCSSSGGHLRLAIEVSQFLQTHMLTFSTLEGKKRGSQPGTKTVHFSLHTKCLHYKKKKNPKMQKSQNVNGWQPTFYESASPDVLTSWFLFS